jgi:hypothetical protein
MWINRSNDLPTSQNAIEMQKSYPVEAVEFVSREQSPEAAGTSSRALGISFTLPLQAILRQARSPNSRCRPPHSNVFLENRT